jgi:hypothetical protein
MGHTAGLRQGEEPAVADVEQPVHAPQLVADHPRDVLVVGEPRLGLDVPVVVLEPAHVRVNGPLRVVGHGVPVLIVQEPR